MKYPKSLLKGNTIGVTAISDGIKKESDFLRMDNARKNIESLGYKIKETENARKSEKGKSSSGKKRAEEFMSLWNDEEVNAIMFTTGGDFAFEALDNLDFNKLEKVEPKWIGGYSDITNLGFVFTTNLDIATVYGPNYKSFGMEKIHESLKNEIRIFTKEEFIQNSYKKCEKIDDFENNDNPYKGLELTQNVEWKALNNEENLEFSGRAIGGCFDIIANLFGTKYDKVSEFVEKYKEDGIVWFLESFESSTPQFIINLWKMKNSGYFKNCKGIIFGRPLFIRNDYEISYIDSIKYILGDLNIPIICDADIGHIAPQISIVNGAILNVKYEKGKGYIKNIFK